MNAVTPSERGLAIALKRAPRPLGFKPVTNGVTACDLFNHARNAK